ncbi:MAG: DUF2497 domain-containing protein [Alphaproteobacteria bacterium]|jgi:cell pole-organizing protein PopZ|nr:DUF2497 domain-containing protein [Alphaproteobacteria bacterium]MCB1551997.1 DUF2497 domain-containing protein [Alphaproteobacteria bacterium]HRK97988.1 DUF2497 domain-containing protein [Alphaproteobacteria bacterium]
MTGTQPDQEPSIEEILASIRQIISDDDTREGGDIEVPQEEKFKIPVYQPEPEAEEPQRESFAEVLELTNEIKGDEKVINYEEDKYDIPLSQPDALEEESSRDSDLDLSMSEEKNDRSSDLDLSAKEGNSRESDLDLSMGMDDIDALFTAPATAATADAFSKLMSNIPIEREENQRLYAEGRITLEDIAKDLMRPMLRQWIDNNVPKLVERLVQKEIEKITRQMRD